MVEIFKSRIEELNKLIIGFLEKADQVNLEEDNIFSSAQSKVDFETKIWHLFHKLNSANYHYGNICNISEKTSGKIKLMIDTHKKGKIDLAKLEISLSISDASILFETDAFFTSLRSTIDFLASVISRYIRGTDFDRFKRLVEFLKDKDTPLTSHLAPQWEEWIEDLIEYRYYLVHKGVFSPTAACYIHVTNLKSSNPYLENPVPDYSFSEMEPIIFALPKKPNPRIRLTRQDIYSPQREVPFGVVEETAEHEATIDGLTYKKIYKRYVLDEDCLEAHTLCEQFLDKTISLVSSTITILTALDFAFMWRG